MKRKRKVAKTVLSLCTVLVLCWLFPGFAYAAESPAAAKDMYEAQYEAAGIGRIADMPDEESQRYLEELGIDGADFDGLYNISLTAVVKLIVSFFRKGCEAPLAALGTVGAVLIFSALGESFVKEENGAVLSAVSGGTLVLCLFAPLYGAVKAGMSCIGLAAEFEKVLIPVLAGLLAAGGNAAAALGFSSLTFAAAQAVEAMSEKVILPLCGASLALGAAGAVSPSLKLGTVGEQMTTVARKAFGFAAGLYSALLGLKEIMARPADTLFSRGIRLTLSSFLPVVGSAVSEAYATVAGSFSLLAATVGGFGMAAVAVTCLPIITELAVWFLVLKVGETAAGMLGLPAQGNLLKSFSSAVSLLNILVVYTLLIFVISSGIVLSFRA